MKTEKILPTGSSSANFSGCPPSALIIQSVLSRAYRMRSPSLAQSGWHTPVPAAVRDERQSPVT
ncbi:hypothetical protein [Pelotomaculum sp. PtaB.Bin117]|uniref:hypothetical protein n=1 Tax=Pelotomaculum sp. PtaB.Bin117 TaxID=1811694 RepID=UPI00257BB8B7|nr:hypothetical protein [Pelotomaculum sp. PtaB.Bin117]